MMFGVIVKNEDKLDIILNFNLYSSIGLQLELVVNINEVPLSIGLGNGGNEWKFLGELFLSVGGKLTNYLNSSHISDTHGLSNIFHTVTICSTNVRPKGK